jgi:Zn-dependent M28 family amino/carboxypeptidase
MPDLSQGVIMAARNAADAAGAAALVILLDPTVSRADIARLATAAQRPTRAVQRVPVFFLRHDRARELLSDGGLDFDAVTGAAAPARTVALAGVTAHVGAQPGETRHMPPNVVGVLPGSDPALRDTYVVFSAHFDHVGVAGAGSWQCTAIGDNRICNGADDNASGTAAILELAEAFAALPVPPRRSLMFLAVSGEEKGLLGSAYFADNPTVPIDSIVANINLDMLGRNHPDSVVVIGQTYSSLGPLLHQVNDRHPELAMTVSDDLWPEQRFFYRSDHFSFARHEVPALFFFTGVHEDYHRPTDTVDRIDLDKITRITRLVFHYGMAIANDEQRPALGSRRPRRGPAPHRAGSRTFTTKGALDMTFLRSSPSSRPYASASRSRTSSGTAWPRMTSCPCACTGAGCCSWARPPAVVHGAARPARDPHWQRYWTEAAGRKAST